MRRRENACLHLTDVGRLEAKHVNQRPIMFVGNVDTYTMYSRKRYTSVQLSNETEGG